MPKIKNRKIISRTDLFRIDKLNIKFDNNQVRDYEVICGTGHGAVTVSYTHLTLPTNREV